MNQTMNRNPNRAGNAAQMKRQQLYAYITRISFAVNDITLYLDTHPEDTDAISYFNHYKKLREEALREYARLYGPLTVDLAKPECTFDWASMPLPWEGGAC